MKNNSERVSIFSFRKGGARLELTLFVVLVLAYTIFAGVYLTPEGLNGWPEILASIVEHVSTFIPVAIVIVLAFEIVGVYMLLLWDLYREERNRQRQEREAALQQARVKAEEARVKAEEARVKAEEARVEAEEARNRTEEANSRAEVAERRLNSWEEWNARRVEAERQNAKFDEPPPSESNN
jgi:membrane protein implicated in regulation of membrane protease activity